MTVVGNNRNNHNIKIFVWVGIVITVGDHRHNNT